jgi:valine dehydrogenase (NAD+)
VGKVGHRLVDHLVEEGAQVVICDVNPGAVERVQEKHPAVEAAADRDDLLAGSIEVFAPCALGGSINDGNLALLNARIVCGAANNQLAHPGLEKLLADRGIVYAPDYVVNSGGVIQVADEIGGFNFERAQARAAQIFDTTKRILAIAGDEGVPPAVAADRLAERRMSEVGRLRGIWVGP